MTTTPDLFARPAPAPKPAHVPSRFAVGDRVKPGPGWEPQHITDRIVPTGEVREVQAWGKGQLLKVGTDRRWFAAGTFVPDEGAGP